MPYHCLHDTFVTSLFTPACKRDSKLACASVYCASPALGPLRGDARGAACVDSDMLDITAAVAV